MQAKTLSETMDEIVRVPVSSARHNMDRAYKACQDILFGLPVHMHQALIQQLQASCQIREIEAKSAIQEHQHAQQLAKQAEAAKPKLAVAN